MRAARLAVAVLVAALPSAPSAAAVTPPPVDTSLLPPPAPPAPSQPTVQRDVCTVPTFDAHRAEAPTQLDGLGLAAAWAFTRGAGQRIAVIDTGVARHRRLPRLVGGGDYVSTGDGTRDCDGNGTLMAGIIAAATDSTVGRFSGVAPEAAVIAIRQSSSRFGPVADPGRSGVGDVGTLAEAVRTAADLGATVISISSVACVPVAAGLDDRALGAALAYAVDVRNAVVVGAAGDTGDDCPAQPGDAGWDDVSVTVSPAWYDDLVLTVGSVDGDGRPSAFTLAGPWVDVAAPGEAVLSLGPVGDALANSIGSGPIAGTGYAAAVVSGLVALVRSCFPDWTPRQVMQRIRVTAHHPPGGRNGFVGAGVVDPLAAISTDAPLATASPSPDVVAIPAAPPAEPSSEPSAGRRTALAGTAVLTVVLLGTSAARRRRPNHIAGD